MLHGFYFSGVGPMIFTSILNLGSSGVGGGDQMMAMGRAYFS
jgi:hypothetical protein